MISEPAKLYRCQCCKGGVPADQLSMDKALQEMVCQECSDSLKLADLYLQHCQMPICTQAHHNRLKGFV